MMHIAEQNLPHQRLVDGEREECTIQQENLVPKLAQVLSCTILHALIAIWDG